MLKVVLAGVERGSSEGLVKQAVRDAAEATTDFSWLSNGDAVFIKPALNSGNPYPATTSPLAIAAMVELLKEKGAEKVVVGDMSGIEHVKLTPSGLSPTCSRDLMKQCGMADAAVKAGAELHFFDEQGWDAFYEDMPVSGDHWKRGLMMPNILKTMDHIVLMPRCGRHVLAGNTLGLKAVVGYWRTDTRLEYHKDAKTFHEKTAEANTVSTLVAKQRLVLTMADEILTTYGPDKGYVRKPPTGLIVASESVIAHDMASLAWLRVSREETPPSEVNWFKDPHLSRLVVDLGNRYIVVLLGGICELPGSQHLSQNDSGTVREDKILKCAFDLLGHVPDLEFVPANHLVTQELIQRLSKIL